MSGLRQAPRLLLSTLAAIALVLVLATSSAADGGQPRDATGGQRHSEHSGKRERAKRHGKSRSKQNANRRARRAAARRAKRSRKRSTRRRLMRANRRLRLGPATAVNLHRAGSGEEVLDAGFEQGLANWNTAGVGEVVPNVVDDIVRSGARSSEVTLEGTKGRSELILGGNGGGGTDGMVEFREGDEYWYGFSFYVESMVYGEPGAHNLIMQLKSDGEGSPNFGLQLWDYEGDDGVSGGRGLWSHGDAMDGDRFLAPLAERAWHDVAIHFRASGANAGFYEVFLNGQLVDARSNVSTIVPGHEFAYVKNGLYRDGTDLAGTSEIRLDAARLGRSPSAVLPG